MPQHAQDQARIVSVRLPAQTGHPPKPGQPVVDRVL
jgi:hypothetical protein